MGRPRAIKIKILKIDLDYHKTRLYGCTLNDTANMSFCDSMPLPVAGWSSLLSIDLSKPSKMPLPDHFDDTNTLEEETLVIILRRMMRGKKMKNTTNRWIVEEPVLKGRSSKTILLSL
jgi:hypothetical protein